MLRLHLVPPAGCLATISSAVATTTAATPATCTLLCFSPAFGRQPALPRVVQQVDVRHTRRIGVLRLRLVPPAACASPDALSTYRPGRLLVDVPDMPRDGLLRVEVRWVLPPRWSPLCAMPAVASWALSERY